MRQKTATGKQAAEELIKDICRAACRNFSAEEKIRFVLEGLRSWVLITMQVVYHSKIISSTIPK